MKQQHGGSSWGQTVARLTGDVAVLLRAWRRDMARSGRQVGERLAASRQGPPLDQRRLDAIDGCLADIRKDFRTLSQRLEHLEQEPLPELACQERAVEERRLPEDEGTAVEPPSQGTDLARQGTALDGHQAGQLAQAQSVRLQQSWDTIQGLMARLQALEHKGRGAVADEVSSPAADEAQVSDNGGEQVVDKVPTGDEAQAVDEAPTGDGAPVSKQVQAEAEVAGGLETHHWHQALLSLREGQRALLERLEVLEAKAAGGDGLGVDGAGEGTERLEAELARSQQERLAIKELQNGLMATVADLAAEMVAFRLASEAQPDVPESGRLAELVEQVQQEVARSQEERLAIKELQNGLTVTVADLSAEMVAFRMAAMEGQLMANGGDESHAERLADLEEKHQAMAAAVDEMTTELKEIHQGFGQVQGLSHSTAIAVTGLTQDFQLMCRQMEAFEGLCARLDKELAGLGPGPRRSGSPSHPVRLVRDSNGRTSGVEGRTESMSPPSDERKPITLS